MDGIERQRVPIRVDAALKSGCTYRPDYISSECSWHNSARDSSEGRVSCNRRRFSSGPRISLLPWAVVASGEYHVSEIHIIWLCGDEIDGMERAVGGIDHTSPSSSERFL